MARSDPPADDSAPAQVKLRIQPVTPARWDDFEHLFESRGAPKNCWCMVWRAQGEQARQTGSRERKAAMRETVLAGTPVGLLGYDGDAPVAWCSVAPRKTFRPLVSDDSPDEGVWSIVCFFILRSHRGQGLARQMLDAAMRHAKAHGAKRVEAYPVDEDSPSYRFMGYVPMFEAAKFKETGREGSRRHVMTRRFGSR